MPVAPNIAILALALAVGGCGGGGEREEEPANNLAGADIEALPADESSATSSNELANGVNDPGVSDLGNQH